jgi:hypothetical protein
LSAERGERPTFAQQREHHHHSLKSEDEQCAENAGAQAALYDILFNVHAVSVLQRKTEPAAQFL